MASSAYTFVQQYEGLDSFGGSTTQEVVFIGVLSDPHKTYVEFPVAKADYPAEAKAAAEGWVTIAETLWEQPNVIGVQQTQVVNKSNQLVYSWIISVQGSSDASWATLTIANDDLGPQLGLARINELHAALVSVDGGTPAPVAEA